MSTPEDISMTTSASTPYLTHTTKSSNLNLKAFTEFQNECKIIGVIKFFDLTYIKPHITLYFIFIKYVNYLNK